MSRRRFDDVSLEIPDRWTNASMITLVGDEGQAFAPTVVMSREEAPAVPLERHVELMIPEMARQFKRHRVIGQGPTTVGDSPGWQLDHVFATPDRLSVRQRQLYFIVGNDLVVAALTAAEAEWDTLAPRFDAIASSLQLHRAGDRS